MPGWRRTSPSVLEAAEKQILTCIPTDYCGQFISVARSTSENTQSRCSRSSGSEKTHSIWTLSVNTDSTELPLVLLHGMGAGVGLWAVNIPSLSKNRPVYAIDLLGFGRSSRANFSTDPAEAEAEYVESIEAWRKEVGLETFILLGHSFGGFLATAYSLKYGEHVSHLILADPWGFMPAPSEEEIREMFSRRVLVLRSLINYMNPFTALRVAGPFGPWFMSRMRPELISKFEPSVPRTAVADYIYHCNAQNPSGEVAFKTISKEIAWATFPMLERVDELPADLPITVIHGRESWLGCTLGYQLKRLREDSSVYVKVLDDAGHHVYADSVDEFNSTVSNACKIVR